ncbi:hypothetical protein HPB49_026560 [Dermacentor silvarum]|uniref:uncharacterized protein LOC119435705 n=1 Tax=Dermacentor silvarum TaxID=543639 RepID=UPI002100C8B8|nr:uncharacterized protein LOC119435705 [Dermacentor silvarum]KAH7985191.1 hypothetical protein HPB49_026560 [Dermacentor silvarum]
MYAFVRFRDDGMKVAVAVERIKNFCPRNLRDFNSTKWYGVRWEDEENSGYFRAQIMKLFATKEEADACTEGVDKRFSCPKMPLYSDSEEDSFTSQESFREEKKNKQKAKSRQKNVEAAFRKKNMQILFPEEQDSRTNELEQEVLKLKSENSKLSARIEMLEKALCSKIFDAEKHKSSESGQKAPPANVRKAQEPSGSPNGPKPAQQPLRSLPEPFLPSGRVDEMKRNAESVSFSNDKSGEPKSKNLAASLYETAEGQVHLGKDVYVAEALYNRLMAAKTDSRFVREAAVAIFSTAGLAGHSVTGAMSNRTKTGAKPALDKTKYSVLSDFFSNFLLQRYPLGEMEKRKKLMNKILAIKISDIMKVNSAAQRDSDEENANSH